MPVPDLEIGLHMWEPGKFSVEMRLTTGDGDTDERLVVGAPPFAEIDAAGLGNPVLDAAEYGRNLSARLFADQRCSAALRVARAAADRLRLRLFLGPSVETLHSVAWETLIDPNNGERLAATERVAFSRYLLSLNMRTWEQPQNGILRVVTLVANPDDLRQYAPGGNRLGAIDVDAERRRVREAVAGAVPAIEVSAEPGRVTLNRLMEVFGMGPDVVYLVCHGAFVGTEAKIWLEDVDGHADVIRASEIVERVRSLARLPRLVVLSSCFSAGGVASGGLSALGPLLVREGIPAVVAMQNSVTVDTNSAFMSAFFGNLANTGLVDGAVSSARQALDARRDAWVPVLYMRLRGGQLIAAPLGGNERSFKKWPALLNNIQAGRCTPVLGPALLRRLAGSRREIARRWAETYRFPMPPRDWDELPDVAQYLSIDQDVHFLRSEVERYMRGCALKQFGKFISEQARNWSASSILQELAGLGVDADPRVRALVRPYETLAKLNLPLYLSANPDPLMAYVILRLRGSVQVQSCPWNQELLEGHAYDEATAACPSRDVPLVYNLFGQLSDPKSLVLTQDNYFDYLLGTMAHRAAIPVAVRKAHVTTGLLFLGFSADDWAFRIVFRTLFGLEPAKSVDHLHVAVQIDPEEGGFLEAHRAQRYLQEYFNKETRVSIFWGSVEEFLDQLSEKLSLDTVGGGP